LEKTSKAAMKLMKGMMSDPNELLSREKGWLSISIIFLFTLLTIRIV